MVDALRRSFLHRAAPVVAGEIVLADLSLQTRSGFKGRGTPEWLEAETVVLPETNHAARQPDGALAVRLGPREVLLLAPTPSSDCGLIDRLDRAWLEGRDPATPCGYPVPRADSHCWFLLTGRHVPAMLAKLCAIDLRVDQFAPLQVAQTQAARLSVILVRDGTDPPAWHVLAVSSCADYLWDSLVDAMQEFAGGAAPGASPLTPIHRRLSVGPGWIGAL